MELKSDLDKDTLINRGFELLETSKTIVFQLRAYLSFSKDSNEFIQENKIKAIATVFRLLAHNLNVIADKLENKK